LGVFEFLTIGIVSISVGSVLKAWIKHRGAALRVAQLEQQVKLLEGAKVDERLSVIEEIVTGTDYERQFQRLEKAEAYKRLPA
jgi:hypothetical protein